MNISCTPFSVFLKLSAILFLLLFIVLPSQSIAQNQDSRSGDEAALQALYASANGSGWNNRGGWSSSGMSLSDNIYGVTTSNIGGELRVTEIDLRDNNLSGSIDFPEIGNLKEMRLFNVAFNYLDTQYPNDIHQSTSLEYLYLSYSDHSLEDQSLHPHEYVATQIPSTLDPGKDSGSGNNIIRGRVDDTIDQLVNLKYFILSYTDDFSPGSRTPDAINGIESISEDLWNIASLEVIQIYDNWNIAHSGNTFRFPASISHITNLEQIIIGGGTGSTWDEDSEGFMTGGYPSDMGELTNITTFWTDRHAELTGFPDLRNSLGLVSLIIRFTNMTGSLPSWVLDGRLTELDSFSIGHPTGSGMTGDFPAVSTAMSKLDQFDPVGHDFNGAIPVGVWDIDPNKINFGENKLTSIGRTDLTDLRSMSTMRFYRNEIRGERWPKLDWGKGSSALSSQFNRIRFEENRYVFADMLYVPDNAPNGETTFELYNALNVQLFSYSPQKPFGQSRSLSFTVGSTLTIDDFEDVVTHPDNRYQWQRNGQDIAGATGRNLTLTNVLSGASGVYRLVVTNPGVPGLTLTSEPIDLTIN